MNGQMLLCDLIEVDIFTSSENTKTRIKEDAMFQVVAREMLDGCCGISGGWYGVATWLLGYFQVIARVWLDAFYSMPYGC